MKTSTFQHGKYIVTFIELNHPSKEALQKLSEQRLKSYLEKEFKEGSG